jgi:hypothetical protein
MKSAWIGWLAWITVVFGLLNTNLAHERLGSLQADLQAGGTPGAWEAVRAYYTNDGDLRRYFAYAQASLGRPYQSYFVRKAEAWRAAFAANEPYRPDDLPEIVPSSSLFPYRDFLVEYPPGFFFVALPIAGLFHRVRAFTLAFQCAMAIALSMALVVSMRTVAILNQGYLRRTPARWAALATLLLGVVATHRYDASVALVLSLGAWALVTGRPVLLGIAAALAFALKGVPLVAFPPLALVWLRERRLRDIGRCAASAAITAAAVMVPVLWIAGPATLETIRYHAARPVQIESTWGALLGLIHVARPGWIAVEKTFGSSNVTAGPSSIVASISTVMTGVGLLATYLATWRRLRNTQEECRGRLALEGLVAALVAVMVCGKVCSPQYLVWILPIGLVLSLTRARCTALVVFLVALGLTQVIYPISYGALESLRPWTLCLVLCRNALLLVWAILMLRSRPEGAAKM